MIFHLLIVDDEAPMRKGLSSFINWEAIDCIVADTAIDGLDAVEIIQKQHIDIIITDIRMPEMDGLELARYVYDNHLDIAVIILTGYAEFEYAQNAIKYNVVQFLLKPTSKEEVMNAVQSAQQQIINSKKNGTIAKNEMAFLKDQFFQELLISNSTAMPDAADKLAVFSMDLSNYYIAAFQFTQTEHEDVNQLKELMISQKIKSYCFRYNNLIMNIYFYPRQEEIPSRIIIHCQEITAMMNTFYKKKIVIGISRYHSGIDEFSVAGYEAIYALSFTFYSEGNIAVFNEKDKQTSYISADSTLALYEVENAMIQLDFSSAASIIKNLYSKLQSNFTNSTDVKNISSQIYYIGYRVLAKRQMIPPTEEYFTRISESTDIYQLETIIEELLEYIRKTLTGSEKELSHFVKSALQYIKLHITENITLESIAEYSHINESYLSRTFKKECGCSITEYITSLRIERAKELLASHDILTYEISEQVGFKDPSYFSLTFKKYTGLSPKEYRRQFHPV